MRAPDKSSQLLMDEEGQTWRTGRQGTVHMTWPNGTRGPAMKRAEAEKIFGPLVETEAVDEPLAVPPTLFSFVHRKGDPKSLGQVVGFNFSRDEAVVIWRGRRYAVPVKYGQLEEAL